MYDDHPTHRPRRDDLKSYLAVCPVLHGLLGSRPTCRFQVAAHRYAAPCRPRVEQRATRASARRGMIRSKQVWESTYSSSSLAPQRGRQSRSISKQPCTSTREARAHRDGGFLERCCAARGRELVLASGLPPARLSQKWLRAQVKCSLGEAAWASGVVAGG